MAFSPPTSKANQIVNQINLFRAQRAAMHAKSSAANLIVKYPYGHVGVLPEHDEQQHNNVTTTARERDVVATSSYTAASKICDAHSQGDLTYTKRPKQLSKGDTSGHSNIHSHSTPVQCTNKFDVLLSYSSSDDLESGATKTSGDIMDSLTATADSSSNRQSESADGSQAEDNTKSELCAMTEHSTGAQSNHEETSGASAPRCLCRMMSLSSSCLFI